MRTTSRWWAVLWTVTAFAPVFGQDNSLVAHWKLNGDGRDSSGRGNHATNHGADLAAPGRDGKPKGAARFDGKTAFLEAPASESLTIGKQDFTLAAWVHTDAELDDNLGDLLGQYDPAGRRGFNWVIKNGAGMTTSQANYRNIQFGFDSGKSDLRWIDCGRPGRALYVLSMAVHVGDLFVGICEPGAKESGHVYRYGGGDRWIDCGSPHPCNSVTSLAEHDGRLYAGVGRYRVAGSSLPESPNQHLGGKVFRYVSPNQWEDCGQLPEVEAVGGMVEFNGALYAASLYRPAGFFRYERGQEWTRLAVPAGDKRVDSLGVWNGNLYASSYDSCSVYRFDSPGWTHVGTLEKTGQTYSFETLGGRFYCGTWPNGKVFRYEERDRWTDVGRLGNELEVMGMAVHNGKLYAGTLPLAEVYRYDGDSRWTNTGPLDLTPNVKYRRAWSMATFQGKLFCGTLPSGRVYSLEAGKSATFDHALKAGWRHLAAMRAGDRLKLFVDSKVVATSTEFTPGDFDLSTKESFRIGFGAHDFFRGSLSDVRVYRRALADAEIAGLAAVP